MPKLLFEFPTKWSIRLNLADGNFDFARSPAGEFMAFGSPERAEEHAAAIRPTIKGEAIVVPVKIVAKEIDPPIEELSGDFGACPTCRERSPSNSKRVKFRSFEGIQCGNCGLSSRAEQWKEG